MKKAIFAAGAARLVRRRIRAPTGSPVQRFDINTTHGCPEVAGVSLKDKKTMIKCNVTVCGTIGRDAATRTGKEEKTFLSFPLRVAIQSKDGQSETVEIGVSRDGGPEEAAGYRSGSRIEATGTMYLKRGAKALFQPFCRPYRSGGDRRCGRHRGRDIVPRKGRSKTSKNGRIRTASPTRYSRRSARRRRTRDSNTSGCDSCASTAGARSGCSPERG